jgi:hypothetical protein
MIRNRILGAAAVAAALAGLAAPAAQAQSALSARGLGYPLDAIDARSRGLGGLTVGLPEPYLSIINPAAVVGLPAAGLSVTYQGDQISSQAGVDDQDYTTSRFPAIQAAFPIGPRFVATLGYASVLDQNWSASRLDSMVLAGEMRDVADIFQSKGGAARLRGGVGYRLGSRFDVGLALDVYTGAVRDSSVRAIEGLSSSSQGTDYTWQGLGLSGGARWRGSAVSVSAVVTGGGELQAEPRDSGVVGQGYGLPLTVDVGASARVAQRATGALSVRWSQWSSADEALGGGGTAAGAGYNGGARDVLQVAGGVEYEGLRLLGRPLPVRLGGRFAELPFRWSADTEFADEKAVTGGLGILFSGNTASLELGAERGWRGGEATGIDESFWRVSFSLALLGR